MKIKKIVLFLLYIPLFVLYRHPENLRNCIKCVGKQREKGMNVKQATDYCNKNCKRSLFE